MSIHINSSAVNAEISERFRAAMDVSSDAMFLIDRSTMTFLDVNRTACRLLGYSRDELLMMAPMMLTGHPREYHENLYDGLIAGSGPAQAREVTLQSKAGAPLTLEIHYLAQLSEAGWIIVAVARDTSEIKRARMMMAQANADMARLSIELHAAREEERSNLAARLHGDLGQLLAALRINLNLLQQQFPDVAECSHSLISLDKLVASSIASLRSISADLRPKGLAAGELHQALLTLLQAAERNALECELRADPADLLLDETASTLIYRLAEEVLDNVLPHASARTVMIEFKRHANCLALGICSDGSPAAFSDTLHPAYRLAGLCERVRLVQGAIQVSTEGNTSRIDISLPTSKL